MQRCSFCGKTEKQHKGKPCVDADGLRRAIEEQRKAERELVKAFTPNKYGEYA